MNFPFVRIAVLCIMLYCLYNKQPNNVVYWLIILCTIQMISALFAHVMENLREKIR